MVVCGNSRFLAIRLALADSLPVLDDISGKEIDLDVKPLKD